MTAHEKFEKKFLEWIDSNNGPTFTVFEIRDWARAYTLEECEAKLDQEYQASAEVNGELNRELKTKTKALEIVERELHESLRMLGFSNHNKFAPSVRNRIKEALAEIEKLEKGDG